MFFCSFVHLLALSTVPASRGLILLLLLQPLVALDSAYLCIDFVYGMREREEEKITVNNMPSPSFVRDSDLDERGRANDRASRV